jgi:hypothetical protein
MFFQLPLDDQIGKTLYINGGLWRLVFEKSVGRFVMRRLDETIRFEDALLQIAVGELLWEPPQATEPLRADTPIETVQQQVSLILAFRQSPAGNDLTDWALRARLDERLADCRMWLTRRALGAGGSSPDAKESGKE